MDMSYKEFCEYFGIYELDIDAPKSVCTESEAEIIQYCLGELALDWRVGGVTGGSCWDDGVTDNHYPVECDDEPEFQKLNDFLMEKFSDMKFFDYKKIMTLMKKDTYTIYEYYGNSTEYSFKWFDPKELYDFLQTISS